GYAQTLPFAEHDFFRIAAAARRPEDPVPGRESGDSRAHAFDHAGHFRARRERSCGLELVAIFDDQRIGEIDARRLDRHEDLSGRRRWIFNLGQFERLGWSGLLAEQCFHGGGIVAASGGHEASRCTTGNYSTAMPWVNMRSHLPFS